MSDEGNTYELEANSMSMDLEEEDLEVVPLDYGDDVEDTHTQTLDLMAEYLNNVEEEMSSSNTIDVPHEGAPHVIPTTSIEAALNLQTVAGINIAGLEEALQQYIGEYDPVSFEIVDQDLDEEEYDEEEYDEEESDEDYESLGDSEIDAQNASIASMYSIQQVMTNVPPQPADEDDDSDEDSDEDIYSVSEFSMDEFPSFQLQKFHARQFKTASRTNSLRNLSRVPRPYRSNISIPEQGPSLENYDYKAFVSGADFGDPMAASADTQSENTMRMSFMFEIIPTIFPRDTIPSEYMDENMEQYLNVVNAMIQGIYSEIMHNMNWLFEPMDRFYWTYLHIACRHEPRVINLLINSPMFHKNFLGLRDNYGSTTLDILCNYGRFDVLKPLYERDCLTVEDMSTECVHNGNTKIAPIFHLVAYPEAFQYFMTKMPQLHELIPDLFVFSLNKSTDTMQYILNNFNCEKIMAKKTNHLSMLMYCLMFASSIFPSMLQSEYCTKALFRENHPHLGNILTMSARSKPEHLNLIMDHEYFEASMFDQTISYRFNIKTNCLYESLKYTGAFETLISNKHFDPKHLTFKLDDQTDLLMEIVNHHPNMLQLLMERDLLTDKHIKQSPHRNLMEHAIETNPESAEILLMSKYNVDQESTNYLKYLLGYHESDAHELIEYMMEHDKIPQKWYLERDSLGYLIFGHLVKHCHELAIDVLKKNAYLENEIMAAKVHGNVPAFIPMILNDGIGEFTMYLINAVFTAEHLYQTNDRGKSLLHFLGKQDPVCVIMIMDQPYFRHYHFNAVDSAGYTPFHYMICQMPLAIINKLKDIMDSKYMSKDHLAIKNNVGNTVLHTAIGRGIPFLQLICNSEHITASGFSTLGYTGRTILTQAVLLEDFDMIKMICNHEMFTEEMYISTDISGLSSLSYALMNKPDIANYLANNKYCTPEILLECCDIGFNTVNQIDGIYAVFNNPNFSSDILNIKADDDYNILMIALLNKSELAMDILKSSYFNQDMMNCVDNSGANCLAYVRTEDQLRLIVDSPYFNINHLTQMDKEGESVLITWLLDEWTQYIKIVLTSKHCDIQTLLFKDKRNICLLDGLWSTDLTQFVIGLSYFSKDCLAYCDENGQTALHKVRHDLSKMTSIINSPHCTSEIMEMQDKYGNTFLHFTPIDCDYLNELFDNKKTTHALIEKCNDSGVNIFTIMTQDDTTIEAVEFFIESKYFTKNCLLSEVENFKTTLGYVAANKPELLEIIVGSEQCNEEVLNHGGSRSAFWGAVTNSNIESLDLLWATKIDFTKTFNDIDDDKFARTLSITSSEVLKMLFNSQYIDMAAFERCTLSKHNMAVLSFSDIDKVKIMVESDYWPEIMYTNDIDNDSLLIHSRGSIEIMEYLVTSDRVTDKFFHQVNNYGRNILHYLTDLPDSLALFVNSKRMSKHLIDMVDKTGETPMITAIKKNDQKGVEILYNCEYYDYDSLTIPVLHGSITLFWALSEKNGISRKMIKDYMNPELMKYTESLGNNTLQVAAMYYPAAVSDLLNSEHVTIEVFRNRNQLGENALFSSAENGQTSTFKKLLNHPYTEMDDLIRYHMDYGSILTEACINNKAKIVSMILQSDKCKHKLLNTLHNSTPFFHLACRYSPDVVKVCVQSDIDMDPFLRMMSDGKYPIIDAITYQPMALKYILESKYGSLNLLSVGCKEGGKVIGALEYARIKQPMSLKIIIESEHTIPEFLDMEDSIGYRLINQVRKNYPSLNDVNAICDINLTHHINEEAVNETEQCYICCEFKKKVVFQECGFRHGCCVACAFNIKNCPICRSEGVTKIVID